MKNILVLIGVVVLIFIGLKFFAPTKWSLFYYPDGCLACVDKWIIEPDFYASREQCRDAGLNMEKARNNYEDTFECGSKCKPFGTDGYMCKETIDY